jgi:hypothetical protein
MTRRAEQRRLNISCVSEACGLEQLWLTDCGLKTVRRTLANAVTTPDVKCANTKGRLERMFC